MRKENPSAFLNYLLCKYEAYRGSAQVRSRPYHAIIDPSDICQLRCPGCWTGIENESRRLSNVSEETIYRADRARISTELFDAVLDELGEYLFAIEFHSWGEPLLNTALPSFVRKAAALGIETQTRTNLSLELTDAQIEELATCGLGTLIASVDGYSQDAYEKYRIGGKIDLIKRNLARLKDAVDRAGSATRILYQYLVFEWNEHEVDAARRFTEELGILFQVRDAIITDEKWLPSYRRDEQPFISAAQVRALADEYAAAGSDYWKDAECHDYWIATAPGLNWMPDDVREDDAFCGWHYTATVIEPNGHVQPCCWHSKVADRVGQVVPGQTSVADVHNGPTYQAVREAYNDPRPAALDESANLCSRCYLPGRFKHGLGGRDFEIFEQFFAQYGTSEPVLTAAFEMLQGAMGAAARKRYTDYFEEHLTGYFDGTKALARGPVAIAGAQEGAVDPAAVTGDMSMEDAVAVTQRYLSELSRIGIDAGKLYDIGVLPDSKSRISAALHRMLALSRDEAASEHFRAGLVLLERFQPGVGEVAVAIDKENTE